MRKSFKRLIIISSWILLIPTALAEGDPVKGKEIYGTCEACHGKYGEGNQATNSPKLAGLHDWYLVGQLKKFRSGLRGSNPGDTFGAQMASIAKSLTGEEAIENVAAYIVTLKESYQPRTETTGDSARGKEQYLQCSRCHGLNAQGFKGFGKNANPRYDSPRLAGQHDWYLIRQIKNFRDGIRGSIEDKAFQEMYVFAKPLTDDKTINDIAACLSNLK